MKKRSGYFITQFFYLNLHTLIFTRKMKQLKFLMVAFTLLMGISLTSCLDSGDNESAFDGGGYLRTVHYMGSSYFVDLSGYKYYPTEASLATMKANYGFDIDKADLVFIYYKNVETETGETSTTGKYIQLVSAEAIDSYRAVTKSSEIDMEATVTDNAPINTLNPMDNYGNTYKPLLYGDEMVILPVLWKMENKAETMAQHSFSLVYIDKEIQSGSTELVFYLRHDKGTDTKTDANAFRYKAYIIKDIMAKFKGVTGRYPAKVTIKAKVATDGITMPETYTDYSMDSSALNQNSGSSTQN